MRHGRRAPSRPSRSPWIYGGIVGVVVLAVAAALLLDPDEAPPREAGANLTPVDAIQHLHGLAVNPSDPRELYVATHHGLLRVGTDGSGLARIGASTDDYMGFSAHPTDGRIAWASGHPADGSAPALGAVKTTDGGRTWTTLALRGTADFHVLAVHRADPQRLHAWAGTYRASADGGATWTSSAGPAAQPTAFAGPPGNATTVLASTVDGVHRSVDGGATWTRVALAGAGVTHVAPDPHDGRAFYAILANAILRSEDGGSSWQERGTVPRAAVVAPDPVNAGVLYVGTALNTIHRSADGGATWTQVR